MTPGGKAPRAAGDRFERACVIRLGALGFYVVRSAGSLGAADIVALRGDGPPLLISCKITDRTTSRERRQFHRIATDAGALAVIATKPGRGKIAWFRIVGAEGLRVPHDVGGLLWPNPL